MIFTLWVVAIAVLICCLWSGWKAWQDASARMAAKDKQLADYKAEADKLEDLVKK